MVFDVSEADFEQRVVERSHEVPVVVDFWAEWCGPCRTLGPALERAARDREGKVDLAKVDVDANAVLAQAFEVQGIPAVLAVSNGQIVDKFTGAIPAKDVEQFFDRLVPSEADELAEAADEESLRAALEREPAHAGAAAGLGRLLLERGEPAQALAVLEPFPLDFAAAGLAARARLALEGDSLAGAWAAWDEGRHEQALELLHEALAARADPAERDLIRQAMVAIFTELGPESDVARSHRRRLAAALN